MRASIRSGAIIGAVASVALCLLQPHIALLVAFGVAAAGVLAGLAVAKWLDLEQYGRQLEEGVRAGALAAGLPGLCALISLLVLGPHDVATLALRSRVSGVGLSSTISQLTTLGWAGLDVLFVVSATVAGILLAAAFAQTFAWSKSRHAAQVIRQARLTARVLQRGETWEPVPASQPSVLSALTGVGIPVPTGLPPIATAAFATGAVPAAFLSAAQPLQSSIVQWPASPRPTGSPLPAAAGKPLAAAFAASVATIPAQDPEPVPASEPDLPLGETGKRVKRKTSRARPVEPQLTDDVRKALAAWAEQNPEAAGAVKVGGRTAVASSYLNSEPPMPMPKRNRKKNETRDWIC